MSPKRTRNAANALPRHKNLSLFVQQFEKEAKMRLNEMEDRMENMLATAEKVFKVELMKLPPALQSTLIGDLISEEELSVSEVSIAMKNESAEVNRPLKRAPSKRGKSTPPVKPSPPVQSTPAHTSSSRATKGGSRTKRLGTLAGSNSTGNLRGSTVAGKRTQSRLTKTSDTPVQTKPKLRSVVSTGDLHCSAAGSSVHITVTTAMGQELSISEETKDAVNLDLMDEVSWHQFHKLKSLMDYVTERGHVQR